MRSTIDRAVIVRLLADPHAICDFSDNRAADRTMGADVLADCDRRARRRWRTGLGLAHAAERQTAERHQRPGCEAGTLHETATIQAIACSTRLYGNHSSSGSVAFRSVHQHGRTT